MAKGRADRRRAGRSRKRDLNGPNPKIFCNRRRFAPIALVLAACLAAPVLSPALSQESTPEPVDDKTYLEAVVAASLAMDRGDEKAAIDTFLPLARRGHPEAQYNVGFMIANGRGADQDVEEATRWYNLAANQNHEIAQLRLGLLLRDGMDIQKDTVRAYMWLSLAAAHGQEEAKSSRDSLAAVMSDDEIELAASLIRVWIEDHKEVN